MATDQKRMLPDQPNREFIVKTKPNNPAEELTVAKEKSDKYLLAKQSPTKLEEPEPLTRKTILIQVLMSFIANLTILSSGMGLGYPATTVQSLTNSSELTTPLLSKEQASWFASVNTIACPIGGLIASYTLDRFGRKNTLVFINVISILAWSITAFTSKANSTIMFTTLLMARIILGLAGGLSSSPAAVYCAEIAHPTLRGRLTIFTSMAIASGILIVYVLGFFLPNNWRLVAGICAIICIVSLLALIFMPESPIWLVSKGNMASAKKSLRKLQVDEGTSVNRKLEQLARHIRPTEDVNSETRTTFWEMIKKPELYKPLAIMCSFFSFQQFSGTFVVVVYAVQFGMDAGVSMDPFLFAVLIGLVRVLATLLMVYILDTVGRRPPAIVSGIGMSICLFSTAFCIWYPPTTAEWLPIFFLLSYMFSSTIGYLTLPFLMIAEIYPQKIRGFGSGITVCAAYTMAFIAIKIYPAMVGLIGSGYVCIFFAVVASVGVVFIYFFLPETKGKTLQEIENLYKKKQISSPNDGDARGPYLLKYAL